ncbi:hypothetical protein IscW_ISCW008856 [Ixodes scapularis]|uniref:Uncharacterized protein n=1 Tax=Ixodes scapularis TaxID=6945 RepID=B7PYS8_IXOSC|nr:hypothetical protein IscW_ISCW008856 [Ixodes scapularis]|eukprot:XP_002403814.1 hypothetical protein IscW_ISCW008856 [Ixodes scapularis]
MHSSIHFSCTVKFVFNGPVTSCCTTVHRIHFVAILDCRCDLLSVQWRHWPQSRPLEI